ncbi:unnamed protein product [Lymnaea stagnalis]|uniref:Protein kinase domain-containing protein n=1 Tax=Lymnaea stagnalis TaxID=6523 RepID=A0AAV2HUQ8_LYMST
MIQILNMHNNLTAESLLMAGEENIKLGCFQLAVDMGNSSETIIEDRRLQPTRWSAPETIKLSVSTPKTDVYMFGHLMYEVLCHGVLPYSHKNISDVECVIQVGKNF